MRLLAAVIIIIVMPLTAHADYDLDETICTNQKAMQRVLTSNICARALQVERATKEIAEEYRTAKSSGGGIIDKSMIHLRQELIKDMKRHISSHVSRLHKLKTKLLPCSDLNVLHLVLCINEDKRETCDDENTQGWLSILRLPKPYDPDNYDKASWAEPRFSLTPPTVPMCED